MTGATGRSNAARQSAARFEGTPAELLRQPAPLLGEQTDTILAELGLSADILAELREAGTIA